MAGKITYEDVVNDVKSGNIAPVYYLMGEEDYYIDRLSDCLLDELLRPEERDFNLDVLYGGDSTIQQVIEMAQGYPMMAERRVVLVREAQALHSIDMLESYLQHHTPTTVVIFCHKHGTLDMRKAASKAIQRYGVVFESKKPYESHLPAFITNYAKQKHIGIDQQATQMLADHVGVDLCRLATEIDKLQLSLPKGEGTITATMVEELTGMSKDYNDFELQAALSVRDVFRSNRIVRYYQSNPRSFALPKTLSNIFTFFTDVMLAYYAPDRSERGVAAWIGKSEWKVRQDILPAMRSYNGIKVMRILGEIRRTDAMSKGVGGCKTPHEELLQDLIFYILH
ncbi:MAG: DNA polymerase III subunit delta [Bacteroidaceae bacterium]|nr:DNA polymerase III subunit delta [Bacteroidaceae bacterium]